MRWVIARVLPVPAPARTHTARSGERGDLALLGVERVRTSSDDGAIGSGLGWRSSSPILVIPAGSSARPGARAVDNRRQGSNGPAGALSRR